MTWPFSLPIWATRLSHSTASKGETRPSVKKRLKSSPVLERASDVAEVNTALSFWSAILGSAISPPRRWGSRGMGTLIFYQTEEPAAWMRLPLLRREPRDSKSLARVGDPKKRKRPPLRKGWLSPRKPLAGGAHA